MEDSVQVEIKPSGGGANDRHRRIAGTLASTRAPWLVAALILFAVSSFFAFRQNPRPNPLEAPGKFPSWDWLNYPVERNPHRRVATFAASFWDLSVLPGRDDVWAVGRSGTVAHSADGGATWEPQSSGTTVDLVSVHFVDASHGWAVGAEGTIVATVDGGATWQSQTSGTTEGLRSVRFWDAARGWAVGARGTIVATANGGATWQPQASGTITNLHSVHFVDATRGWAVGGREIVATSDGGATWRLRTTGTTTALVSVHFVDAVRGWAVGSRGAILATVDGGARWEPQSSGTTTDLHSMHFVDATHGWAVGTGGTIVATADGGATWQSQTSGTTTTLLSVHFADTERGWAVGGWATILTTADGGATWQPLTRGTAADFYSVYFADAKRGWAAGLGGLIVATADGGTSWQSQTNGTTGIFYSVHFVDATRGWAVGDRGTILATADGGTTWESQTSGTTTDLYSLHFVDAARGWAVGDAGKIVATTDEGASWQAQTIGTTSRLFSVHFVDAARGWVVGEFGTILATTDGGTTWVLQVRETTAAANLQSVHFVDASRGWAVRQGGEIIATTDGGTNWQAEARLSVGGLRSVYFLDATRGWAVGGWGTIVATEDGGASWRQQTSGTTGHLISVHFVDAERGWAVGIADTLLTTANGGTTWQDPRAPYERWPAPWYYLTWLPIALLIRISLRKVDPQERESPSVADRLVSDRPLEAGDPDAFELQDVALGLSRFLRNENTQPPLTLAITGTWGSGKSSLMNLLRADLQRYGFRPVWFNAWHHQNEEQLLPSLLQSIRSEAVPSWSRPDGWLFRAKIIAIRGWREAVPLALVLIILSASAGWLSHGDTNTLDNSIGVSGSVGDLWEGLKPQFTALELDQVAKLVAFVISFLTLLRMIWSGVKAFGVNPARLLVTPSHPGKSALEARPGLRQKFSKEFRDVNRALGPRRMVIFIDDLDRCRPENVLEVLEGVNFLVSSGDCFVVMGLAKEQVEACVGLAFEKIAEEIEEMAVEQPENANLAQKAKRRRIEYARQYLRKLINIEIPVPKPSPAQAQRLLTGGAADEQTMADVPTWHRGIETLAQIKAFIPAALLAGFLVGPYFFVQWYMGPQASGVQESAVGLPAPAEGDSPSPTQPQPDADEPLLSGTGATEEPRPVIFRSGETATNRPWVLIALPILGVFLLAGWWVLSQRPELVVKDSTDFRNALAAWHPVIHRGAPTPRELKRFLNRVRYFAMRQRPQEESSTVWQQMVRRLQKKTTPQPLPATGDSDDSRIPEDILVALAALHGFREELVERVSSLSLVSEDGIDELTLLGKDEKEILRRTIGQGGSASRLLLIDRHRQAYLRLAEGIQVQ